MVNIGIIVLDGDLRILHWNRWMALHSGIPQEDIIGKSIFDFYPNLNTPRFLRSCKSVLTFGNFSFFSQKLHRYLFPFKPVSSFGSKFEHMQQSCTMGPLRDENNIIKYLYISVQDVTEVVAYEQSLLETNMQDSLTGIYNRRYLEVYLKREFEKYKRYSRGLSLAMLDIDFFKSINDAYGHQCGDFILKSISAVITSVIRRVDFLARYGGEEFCCLFPETGLEQALAVAERIRETIAAKIFHYRDERISVTASLGVSELRDGVDTAEMLLKIADEALYEAKRRGRNLVLTLQPITATK
jgi:diguanylate cyclase (GGDEF)-like protein/PAS domain S-box-containing protein